jgi:hypothetical protein
VTCIANVAQYFEPLLHLFQDIISTDNAIHGSNFGLYTLHKPFPVYPHFHQSLTMLLLYVKNPMKYFTNQQNIRKTEFHFPYQQQHTSETAKDVETYKGMHFYRT